MSDDKVILWAMPPSSNSGVLRTFLLASEIPFEEKNAWGQTRTPEYIAKFPNNGAPALEHGAFTMAETVSCMRYLAKAFPDKAGKFYPADDIQKAAIIDMTCDMINTGVCVLIPKAVYPTLGFPSYAGDVASMDCTKEHTALCQKDAAAALLDYINNKIVGIFLAKTKYLLSDTPTLADFRLAPMLSQIKCAFQMPPKMEEYLKAMDEVPGYVEGMKPVEEFNSQFWAVGV